MAVRTLFLRHGEHEVRFAFKDGVGEMANWFSIVRKPYCIENTPWPWAYMDIRALPEPFGAQARAAAKEHDWAKMRAAQKRVFSGFFDAGGELLHEIYRQWMERDPRMLSDFQKSQYEHLANERGGMFVATRSTTTTRAG